MAEKATTGEVSQTASWPAAWANAGSARLWFGAGLGFVAAALALLELINPFFFCQDDALVLELPAVLLAMRSLWQGVPATYNPFIFLGSPTPSIGGFYPPMPLAYAIARHLLGNEYATFDVFAAIHLLGGYCLAFLFARRVGIGPPLAALASATFVLSGPVLVMARCWHSFSVLPFFIPLFALLADRLRRGRVNWLWPAALGIALGAYYHSGFPQLFVLGCGIMLVHAASLAVTGLVPTRRLVWLVPALCFGAALSVPVFYQQWRLAKEITLNDAGGGEGVGGNLLSMLLPYPLVQGTLPNGWGSVNLQWNGHFYYFGTVLLVAFLVGLAALFWRAVRNPGSTAEGGESARLMLALAIPAVVAFLLALGESGGLWWLMGLLPVGLRNNPFRAIPWFVFFASVAGARWLEAFLAAPAAWLQALRLGPDRRSKILAGCVGVGTFLILLHLTRVGIAFYSYSFQPYPPLPDSLAKAISPAAVGGQHRIMSFAAMRTTDPSYPLALPHNLPCHYEVPALFSYDPLVQRFGRYAACLERLREDPRKALAAYGVRWLFVHRTVTGGWMPQTPNRFELLLPFADLLESLGDIKQLSIPDLDDSIQVLAIPEAVPLAFDVAEAATSLPMMLDVSGASVGLEPTDSPRRVVFNLLWYPDLAASVDGMPVPVIEDEWHRSVVVVPAGARDVQLRYKPPTRQGILVALGLFGAGAVCLLLDGWLLQRHSLPKRKST